MDKEKIIKIVQLLLDLLQESIDYICSEEEEMKFFISGYTFRFFKPDHKYHPNIYTLHIKKDRFYELVDVGIIINSRKFAFKTITYLDHFPPKISAPKELYKFPENTFNILYEALSKIEFNRPKLIAEDNNKQEENHE